MTTFTSVFPQEGKKIAKLAECTGCGQPWELPLGISARSACQTCGAPMKEVGEVREEVLPAGKAA